MCQHASECTRCILARWRDLLDLFSLIGDRGSIIGQKCEVRRLGEIRLVCEVSELREEGRQIVLIIELMCIGQILSRTIHSS